jgi:ABC-type spermidine/putrescine transport system permease subunit I
MFFANLIDIQINQLVDWRVGSALAVILVASGLGILWLTTRLIGWDWLIGGDRD